MIVRYKKCFKLLRSPDLLVFQQITVAVSLDRKTSITIGIVDAMNELQIYTRLSEIFHDVFDEDSITMTPELSAKDVDGWDSLTNIRLMLTVEKAFKVKFTIPEIGKLENVGDLVKLIKARS